MSIKYSVIISSFRRLEYLKRTLYSIANNQWPEPYEVVLSEEQSEETDDIIKELHRYNKVFNWTIALYSMDDYTKATGLKKVFNNPSLGNNIAFNHSYGQFIFHMGNEVIARNGTFRKMIDDYEKTRNLYTLVYSTTYDIPKHLMGKIGEYGELIDNSIVSQCSHLVFQSPKKQSLVTNYLSLAPREAWIAMNGYDCSFLCGIACEDSHFSLRFCNLPKWQWLFSEALTLHQNHDGINEFQQSSKFSKEKWDELVSVNRKHYHTITNDVLRAEKGLNYSNFGMKDVISNKLS